MSFKGSWLNVNKDLSNKKGVLCSQTSFTKLLQKSDWLYLLLWPTLFVNATLTHASAASAAVEREVKYFDWGSVVQVICYKWTYLFRLTSGSITRTTRTTVPAISRFRKGHKNYLRLPSILSCFARFISCGKKSTSMGSGRGVVPTWSAVRIQSSAILFTKSCIKTVLNRRKGVPP